MLNELLQIDRSLYLKCAHIEKSKPKPNRRHLIQCAKNFGRVLERDVQKVLNINKADALTSTSWK